MQEQEPYVMTRSNNVIRRVYWGRIAAFLLLVSFAVLGAVVWFSRGKKTVSVAARTYWFVSVGSFDSQANAAARAQLVESAGGAGYVHEDGAYHVFVSCYPAEDDALTVGDRLSGMGEVASVYALSCPAVTVEKPKDNRETAEELLRFPSSLFDSLYDVAIKTDKKEIGVRAALLAVRNMAQACKEKLRLCDGVSEDVAGYCTPLITAIIAALDRVTGEENAAFLPQRIKYALCSVAVEICKNTQDFENNTKNRA